MLLNTKYRADPNLLAGQLATRTWARGVTTTYDYDPATGSLTDVDYSDATPDVVNTYDRMGRQLTSAALGVVTNTFAYDPASLQLTTETWQGLVTDTLTRLTDPLGRNSGFQTLGGMSLDYAYDATGRFGAITSVVATVTNVATYAYVPNSRLLTGYTMGGFTRTVDFETDRNLIASVVNTFGTNLVSRFDYTNDALGRRTQRLDTGTAGFQPATNSFAYNVRSELETASFTPPGAPSPSLASYQYDLIGNRIQSLENSVQTDYVSNMLNQYTGINTNSPSYDDDGNMLFLPSTTGGGKQFTWDGENRMITTTNGNTVVVNTYDAQSRRIRKKVSVDGTPAKDIRYFYDAWNLLYEHDLLAGGSGSTRYYAWGLDLSQSLQGAGGVGGLLYTQAGASANAPAYDANGNVTEYVDLATGAVTSRQAYDGFGKTIAQTGSRPAPYAFSTKYEDEESGLLYYGFRYYAPEIGRWPNRDPIGERGGTNLSQFLNNNAVKFIDYLGRDAVEQFEEVAKFSCTTHVAELLANARRDWVPNGWKSEAVISMNLRGGDPFNTETERVSEECSSEGGPFQRNGCTCKTKCETIDRLEIFYYCDYNIKLVIFIPNNPEGSTVTYSLSGTEEMSYTEFVVGTFYKDCAKIEDEKGK